MATTIDSSYALNFGLAGLPVEAEFPTAALPDSRAIPPTGMPYVGEVDRLLAAGGTSALIRQWGHPKTVSPEVLSSSGFTDALEQVRQRLDARPRAAGERSDAPEVDLALRRLNAEVRQMLSLRDLVRQNQSLLLQG
ncbi:MAG: hypothetical protein ACO29W_14750 [Burkholderiaceae bacterium]|jgi:hypothetical protein